MFRKILLIDKIPYLLSLLFISFGWYITFLVQKLEQLTLVEYKIERNQEGNKFVYDFLISNINSNKLIRRVDFYFKVSRKENKYHIVGHDCGGIAPAIFDSLGELARFDDADSLWYLVPALYFQPLSSLKVRVKVNGGQTPILQYQSAEKVTVVMDSFLTTLYKNYLVVFLFLFLIWIILIFFYFRAYVKYKDIPDKQTS